MRACALLVAIAACKGDPPAPAPAPAPAPTTPPAPAEATPPAGAPSESPATASPYARDLDRICNVERLAAADQPGVVPALVTAQWLAANLESQEARDFLVRWNGTAASERATTLDGEAARVGLTACPTARAWDGK
jgi:hypothetical protein